MNAYIDLAHTFEHFYARKTMFVKAAEGFVVFRAASAPSTSCSSRSTLIQTARSALPRRAVRLGALGGLRRWIDERLIAEDDFPRGPRARDGDRRSRRSRPRRVRMLCAQVRRASERDLARRREPVLEELHGVAVVIRRVEHDSDQPSAVVGGGGDEAVTGLGRPARLHPVGAGYQRRSLLWFT